MAHCTAPIKGGFHIIVNELLAFYLKRLGYYLTLDSDMEGGDGGLGWGGGEDGGGEERGGCGG